MSAKFIYSITDENPDLKKQIGCMNGIFQLLSSRRINGIGHNHKRLPQGQNSKQAVQPNSPQQKVTLQEKNTKKVVKEKRRISTESSRTSFSSSSCSSSFSSIDYNRTTQIEQSQSSQTSFAETPTRDLLMNKPNASKQSSRQSLDLRDVVKDSMHREVRGVSVKTATKDAVVQTLKYIDSPRPSQPQKSVEPRFSGLNESLRVYGEKDGCTHSAPKEIRRLSYDASLSYDGKESQDTLKSTIRHKELPRLSLDSRERFIRGESKSNYLRKDLQREKMNCNETLNLQQEPGSSKRPSSFIVAKLMGLEAFPDSMSTPADSLRLTSTCQTDKYDPLARSSRASNENKTDPFSGSSRNSHKAVASLQMKNADAVTKATLSQKFPIETAPWRHPHGSRGSQSSAFKCQEAPTKTTNSSPSVYGEFEKRLAQLDFKTSAKDLRALKQILEAMQKTKEILDDKKDQTSTFVAQMSNNSNLDQSNLQSNISNSPGAKASKSPKSYKSPIVIMKPAKLVGKNTDPTSTVSSNNSLFGLPKLQTNDLADNRKNDANKRTAKSATPKRTHIANPINQHHSSMDKITNSRTSKMPQNNREDKGASSGKTSGTLSPRLQQRRFMMDGQACLPSQSDPSKTRRQQSRHPIESDSPGRKYRPKSPNPQRNNDHLCESTTNIRALSHQDDDSSLQSESNASNRDNEVTSIIQPAKTNDTYFKHKQKQKQKNPAARLSENRTMAEPARAISEQPSPVSVLDATFYRDDSPSPVKKTSNAFKDDDALYADEVEWDTEDPAQVYMSRKSSLSADEIDHKILENISLLIQNPQQLNCIYKESIMCPSELHYDSTNPDHIYILDILSASGLLRNLDSGLTNIQSQPSDKLINPNLFLELEQIKESTQILSNEYASKKVLQSIPDQKIQRKLVFDVVNEIVVRKLVVQDSFKQWLSPEKLSERKPRGQRLLRELCSEVDRLQGNNSNRNQDDEDDSLGSILCEDMMHWLLNWTECSSEIPEVVLDIERLIFKDLITEVVSGESAGTQGRPGGHCRQLFSK